MGTGRMSRRMSRVPKKSVALLIKEDLFWRSVPITDRPEGHQRVLRIKPVRKPVRISVPVPVWLSVRA
jgi:hypothetical protein